MKKMKLRVRQAKASDVYKDVVRIDIQTRGDDYEESKIYWLEAAGKRHLVSVRGMADEQDSLPNAIRLDEKTRRKFGIDISEEYDFTLSKPFCQPLALMYWSCTSSDPLQRMAAIWGIITGLSFVLAILALFGFTIPGVFHSLMYHCASKP